MEKELVVLTDVKTSSSQLYSVCVQVSQPGNYFNQPEKVWLLLGRAELHQIQLRLNFEIRVCFQ